MTLTTAIIVLIIMILCDSVYIAIYTNIYIYTHIYMCIQNWEEFFIHQRVVLLFRGISTI